MWATDSIFRSKLVGSYTPLFIVTLSHCICLVFTLPLFIKYRKSFRSFVIKDWIALLFLSIGGSAGAMILFTMAFQSTSNYTVPILIQKLQPIIAITFASIFLGEKIKKKFWLWSISAMIGAYLISFNNLGVAKSLLTAETKAVFYALGAATIWGGCTIAGKVLLGNNSFIAVTAFRYVTATIVLLIGTLVFGDSYEFKKAIEEDFQTFISMALIAGLFALLIYYSGLKKTKASVATICELSFPLGAVTMNWIFLGSALSIGQLIGTAVLIGSVTILSYENSANIAKT